MFSFHINATAKNQKRIDELTKYLTEIGFVNSCRARNNNSFHGAFGNKILVVSPKDDLRARQVLTKINYLKLYAIE
jgi:hypothetical protein